MDTLKGKIIGLLVALLAGCFIGAAVVAGWYAPLTKTETAATEERQSDGSLALARQPGKAKPANAVPKGGKPERVISVDVQPARADCPLCRVDLTLVRMPDDGLRVVASSPTGTVVAGLDVPIVPLSITKKRLWGVGGSRGTNADSWGLWLDRDFAMVRTGIELNKTGEDQAGESRYEARVKLGFTF